LQKDLLVEVSEEPTCTKHTVVCIQARLPLQTSSLSCCGLCSH